MTTQGELNKAAKQLFQLLEELDRQIVFAESCTGGLVAATMARVPGVSRRLCGSAVVYQIETKEAWLEIPHQVLALDAAVSREAASRMAEQVLKKTPQAAIAVSITGHLGPNAPRSKDGLIYIGVARRGSSRAGQKRRSQVFSYRLDHPDGQRNLRIRRQKSAVLRVLDTAFRVLGKWHDV